jgi:hypothetical protein
VAETADLKSLARRVLQRDTSRDNERDGVSRQGETASETPRQYQGLNPAPVSAVSPVSGVSPPTMAYRATSTGPDGTGCKVEIIELPATGLRYRRTFAHLRLRPPAHIPEDRWRQAVEDGRRFLAQWGNQAEALGWTARDLFGLHTPPERPHPSYRLSRYDCNGLCWLLQGRSVTVLTETTATIRNLDTGSITTYRRC